MVIIRSSALFALLVLPCTAWATLGAYEHGAGIKSQGAGGITYAYGEDSIPISYNPALTVSLGNRNDIGISLLIPTSYGEFEGNSAAPDERYKADGQKLYSIPQGGLTRRLNERWSAGLTLYSAGLGPDYRESPFARFGGASRVNLTLASSGAALALAWQARPHQAFGVSIIPGYQMFRANGLQFLGSDAPETRASARPDRTTGQGLDGSLTIGGSVGWHGEIVPGVVGGISYRTKTWAQKHRAYRGLLPDGGGIELPAIWGGGVAWTPARTLTLAVDFQRFEYEGERAFGNRIVNLSEGNLLGDKNGPGFGFRNQDAYKFGAFWRASDVVTLRAGYIHATSPARSSETFFNLLGAINTTTHYTAGATWMFGDWELSGFGSYAPTKKIQGENSVGAAFGGGEANTSYWGMAYGLSVGWGFGGQKSVGHYSPAASPSDGQQ